MEGPRRMRDRTEGGEGRDGGVREEGEREGERRRREGGRGCKSTFLIMLCPLRSSFNFFRVKQTRHSLAATVCCYCMLLLYAVTACCYCMLLLYGYCMLLPPSSLFPLPSSLFPRPTPPILSPYAAISYRPTPPMLSPYAAHCIALRRGP
eukprot:3474436-Rhodomonas_salina.2